MVIYQLSKSVAKLTQKIAPILHSRKNLETHVMSRRYLRWQQHGAVKLPSTVQRIDGEAVGLLRLTCRLQPLLHGSLCGSTRTCWHRVISCKSTYLCHLYVTKHSHRATPATSNEVNAACGASRLFPGVQSTFTAVPARPLDLTQSFVMIRACGRDTKWLDDRN
jgi:hypothetical protein